ncbi:MAG: carbohydrate binding domain-containing protein [Prevotella sp.]|nr:carbohydrate binding domain-containing protein [Prevotella sp.]MDD7046566.1 alpha-L-arabinofuranosidase C-terminal domain-containing protein [Prevotella sp.]MDY5546351.1 alpha-L-arabinofuranosidase C-terminal domain-containing protein [Prevotella sp.]
MKSKFFNLLVLAALSSASVSAQHLFTVDAGKKGAPIQPTMYGIFFEDINFGADGGLYADLIENRSFEFPQSLMGWDTYGKVTVNTDRPAFERNPHYVTIDNPGHRAKVSGLENHGFFGIGLRKDMTYEFSAYLRPHVAGSNARIRVELVNGNNDIVDRKKIEISGDKWQKYTATLTAKRTDEKGTVRIILEGRNGVDADHISLFPGDNWHGLRADLVKDLEDLHPGIFRFPGGCIVEGADLNTRYQWKNTVGPVENRPLNENRWIYAISNRLYPNYYQSYGLGFYEYFLLSEKLGAEPLPVLSCGIACQYQNSDKDSKAHVAPKDLQPYIDDALDLIEFANGPVTSKWGKVRAEMGHPAPFNLKQIGIGNEQWEPLYAERLAPFVKAIRAKYPKMKICGSSGPSADGDRFDQGWAKMKELKVDLVDEHYYKDPEWFLKSAARYDNYDRKGPKVFAGEYACHNKARRNNWQAALSEAAFMTGLERNADVVWQCTYAPLFSHVDGWQWRPDLIWFNNTESVRSANWYVQMLYSTNKGTNVLKLTENGKPVTGAEGLYASAVYDKNTKQYIVKIANTGAEKQDITLTFKGVKQLGLGTCQTMQADEKAENSLRHKDNVVPKESSIEGRGNIVNLTIPAKAFKVIRL